MLPNNIPEQFIDQVKKNPDKTAFQHRLRRNTPYKSITWDSVNRIVIETSLGLKRLGLKKGDNVAILSATRYEWAIADLAILSLGAVVVPLYPTLGDHAVNYILNDSKSRYIFIEDKGQLQKIRSQWKDLPHIEFAIVLSDLGDLPVNDSRIITFKNLKDLGKLSLSKEPTSIESSIKSIKREDIASIIYTSGTTGNPKGVVLTHNNFLSVVQSTNKAMPLKHSDKFLSFLPLSHVFERVGGLHFAISRAVPICFCSSMDQIAPALKDSGATIMLVVPRLLEKMYSKININLNLQTGFKKKLIDWAFKVGKKIFSKNAKLSVSEALIYYPQYLLADRLVFFKIRKSIAPTLRCFISGGAPLSKDIAEFFFIIGIKVLEGYGLTETSAPATVNRLDDFKLGTVGLPLENIQIQIAQDGEILIKGPTVFSGYYKNDQATKEAFKDGWFCTGDIGVLDREGFLKITDRKKDIIVSSAGKNIAPQNIENAVKTSDFISNVIVIGDKRKYLSALIALDRQHLEDFIKQNNIPDDTSDLVNNSKIIELIDEEIKVKLSDFADYEQIRKFTILPNDFTIETGELTPTLKVKRKFVEEKYKGIIDAMYPPD